MRTMRDRRTSAERSVPGRPDQPFQPAAGLEPLPGYRLTQLRGRGGFATVWEADCASGERIAMKFMSSQNSSSTARELRSLQAIQKLSHPRLLRTRQVWSLPGQIVIAMDLADASLLDLFMLYQEEFGRAVDKEKVCLYLYQAAEALDFLNARRHSFDGGTVAYQHGDIKPNNILLVNDRAMLADYGMSTPMFTAAAPCPRQGTLEYAAPEIFAGTITETSDQFSLAVTYYLLRTGGFPFPTPPANLPKNYQRPPADVSLAERDEQPVLLRALSPVPQDRFPTCTEMMNQFLKALQLELVRDSDRGMSVRQSADSLSKSKLLLAVQNAKALLAKSPG
jgi:serine/threonine protein kinase, bacterial